MVSQGARASRPGAMARAATMIRIQHGELPQLGLPAAAATHLERLVASRTR